MNHTRPLPLTLTLTLTLTLLLASCGGGSHDSVQQIPTPPAPINLMDANQWTIGPITFAGNASKNMPQHPSSESQGFSISFSSKDQQPNYLTIPYHALRSDQCFEVKYLVETTDRIVPVNYPENDTSMLGLWFQRRGDNWMADAKTETYRWYSPELNMPIVAGEYTIRSCFNENWTAVLTSSAQDHAAEYAASLADTAEVGITLGGGTGRGHGVYSLGTTKITFENIEIK